MNRLHAISQSVLQFIPTWVWFCFFLAVLAGHGYRTFSAVHVPGSNTFSEQGFVDFHNAIYFPTKAFLNGENPYCRKYAETHPDGRAFPLFPPHSLILHLPFAMVPISTARILYFGFEVVLFIALVLLAYRLIGVSWSIRGVLMLGSFILVTVPFYSQVYLGQLTLQLVLASWIAVGYARNSPLLSGVALAVAACKPQFAVPISIMLLFRGDWKPVLIGGVIATTLSVIGILAICANFGLSEFAEEIRANYFSLSEHPDIGKAEDNYRRIDIYPLFSRFGLLGGSTWSLLVVSISCLAVGGLGVYSVRHLESATPLATTIVFLTTVGCVYHSLYDGLLLILPLTSIWLAKPEVWGDLPSVFRRAVFLGLMVPMLNVLHLSRVLDLLHLNDPSNWQWNSAVSVTSLFILVTLLYCVFMAICFGKRTSHSENRPRDDNKGPTPSANKV